MEMRGVLLLGYNQYGGYVVCMEGQNPLRGGIGAFIIESVDNGIKLEPKVVVVNDAGGSLHSP